MKREDLRPGTRWVASTLNQFVNGAAIATVVLFERVGDWWLIGWTTESAYAPEWSQPVEMWSTDKVMEWMTHCRAVCASTGPSVEGGR